MQVIHQLWLIQHFDVINDIKTLLKQLFINQHDFITMRPPTQDDMKKAKYKSSTFETKQSYATRYYYYQLPNNVMLKTRCYLI